MPNEILSLWRSPLDKVALSRAQALAECQPRCTTIVYGEDLSMMTVYNFGYYVETYSSSYNDALTEMLYYMSLPSGGAIGGLAFIPQQGFALNYASEGFPFTVADQSVIVGSGGGGIGEVEAASFFHFVITPEPASGGATQFLNCPSGDHTSGGVYFRSLAFRWLTSSFAQDTCILAKMWNVRAVRCTFTDCPCAFSAQAESCTLEQCTINYTVAAAVGPNNTNAVILSGAQCAVLGPGVFSQTSPAPESGGATGCTCIAINSVEHAVIANMQLYEWTLGVDFSQGGGARHAQITNCEIECWQTALNIVLSGSGSNTIIGLKVTSCTLAKTADSNDGNPIITIDANGGNLHDVTLLDCTVFNMANASAVGAQHGVEILAGYDIKIIGGTYSNNGPLGGAGIAINGAPTDVQIIGVNLQPKYPGAPNSNSQQYALLISGNPSGVLVSGCDMTGYGAGGPVYVPASSTPTNLLIVDCPGYNDQNTPLNLGAAPTSTLSASNCANPYFGPSVIAYSNATPVTLNVFGQSITASMGIVFLPTPYDAFFFNTAPTSFSWIGH